MKSKYTILITLLLLTTLAFISKYGLARYKTTLSGNGASSVAKWSFNVNAGSFQNLVIDLAQTRYENDTTSVDRTKVAPGTKGALEFDVNANGTQVALQYNINLTLTQIPENLMFYTNEEMTNALYKENGQINLVGFFEADNENKLEKRMLYWQWKFETGATPEEIKANDLIDSKWMGSNIVLEIEAIGKQIIDDASKQYDVSFDLQGGSFENYDGVNQITKKVGYGTAYGELPVPVRDGYTFLGWNGKNMFNIKKAYAYGGNTNIDGDKVYLDTSNVSNNVGRGIQIQKFLNDGTFVGYLTSWNGNKRSSYIINKDASFDTVRIKIDTTKSDPAILIKNVNMIDGKVYILSFNVEEYNSANCTATLSEIQLEEGNVSTEYESYYISETTKVTQNKNHTLTAIWKKN